MNTARIYWHLRLRIVLLAYIGAAVALTETFGWLDRR